MKKKESQPKDIPKPGQKLSKAVRWRMITFAVFVDFLQFLLVSSTLGLGGVIAEIIGAFGGLIIMYWLWYKGFGLFRPGKATASILSLFGEFFTLGFVPGLTIAVIMATVADETGIDVSKLNPEGIKDTKKNITKIGEELTKVKEATDKAEQVIALKGAARAAWRTKQSLLNKNHYTNTFKNKEQTDDTPERFEVSSGNKRIPSSSHYR